ncbi:N-acetylmuramoyl-L-alanine amidase [Cedecea davisae]|uniref:N-acetylmuramoyl-L-alanine amidase n=1 Tax=Cedecea davisae TaxID=158484 RepID=UPI0024315AEB|nr:N-acetylmuramoyl-L-alanine amidase [Cedecea davisae]
MPIDQIATGIVPGIRKGTIIPENKEFAGEIISSLSQLKYAGQAGSEVRFNPAAPIKIDYNAYRSVKNYNPRIRFLIMYYTAQNFADSVTSLTGNSVSAHYLLPDPTDKTYLAAGFNDMCIFNLVDEKERAWHAGVSNWAGRSNINDTSFGIEIVNQAMEDGQGNLTFPPFNQQQIEAVRQLSLNIIQRYPDISPNNIVGHSDIAHGRKNDPGAAFPWQQLSEVGIGAWYEETTKTNYQEQFTVQMPAESKIIDKFSTYGYDVSVAGSDEGKKSLFQAFQLHFRQSDYAGEMDAETAAIIYALVDKYISKSH